MVRDRPAATTGSGGNYYLDTTSDVLYGPKDAAAPALQQLTIPQTVTYAGGYTMGHRMRFAAAGYVHGVAVYVPPGTPSVIEQVDAHIWTATGTQLLASAVGSATGGQWTQLFFSAPVSVAAATSYMVSCFLPVSTRNTRSFNNASASGTFATGDISYQDVWLTFVVAGDAFPTTQVGSLTACVTPMFSRGLTLPWPVAMSSGVNEVVISVADPITTNPNAELWFDSDEPTTRLPLTSFGATPHVSPIDGDEWVYPVDTVRLWKFRYRAAAASYKWQFVGGATAQSEIATGQTTTTTGAWLDLATVGPSFTVPFAGWYHFQSSARGTHTLDGALIWIALYNMRTAAGSGYSITTYAGASPGPFPASVLVAEAQAGDTYRLRYHSSSAGTATWSDRWLTVTPLAVTA